MKIIFLAIKPQKCPKAGNAATGNTKTVFNDMKTPLSNYVMHVKLGLLQTNYHPFQLHRASIKYCHKTGLGSADTHAGI
jgi:hypothetical protein